jgi:hypothetical protein
MTKSNYCVYRHRRLDNNEIFYVGIGNEKRPYSKEVRNNLWNKVINKTNYTIEVLYTNLNKTDAIDLEMLLISEYGRKDLNTGVLANLTDGGEGLSNYKMSESTKLKLGVYNKREKSKRKKDVYQYDLNNNFIKKWNCIKSAEESYNNNPNAKNIVACCNNKQSTAYGYIWKHSPSNKSKPLSKKRKEGILIIDNFNNKKFISIKELTDGLKVNYNTFKNKFYKIDSEEYGRYKRV